MTREDPSPISTSAAVAQDLQVPDRYRELAARPIEVDLHDVWAEAWDRFTGHAPVLVGAYFVLALITTALTLPVQLLRSVVQLELLEHTADLGLISVYLSSLSVYLLESAFLDPWLTNGGMLAMSLVIARGGAPGFGDAFSQLRRFFPLLLTGFGAAFFAALGGLALFAPGLILLYLFSFALLLVLEQGEGPLEALVGSARVAAAHWRRLLLPLLGCAGLFVAGKLTCGLGMLVAGPLIALVHVGLYERAFAARGAFGAGGAFAAADADRQNI